MHTPRWPHRYKYLHDLGYVVWRDVFEGKVKNPSRDSILDHKVAVFVRESEASNYCEYRNIRTMVLGTDDVTPR